MSKKLNYFTISFIIAIAVFIGITFWVISYTPISPVINAGSLILGFFIVTIIFALCNLGDLYVKLRRVSKDIEESIKFLDIVNFDDIDNKFLDIKKFFKNNSLKEQWESFDKTIRRIKVGQTNDGDILEKYFTTVEASYFFDEDIILGKFNNKIHNYIPQLLTAIGIFGTFLGLVLGLQTLHMTGDVQKTKDSIQLLIDGIKISFKTSLYGILYSMIITFYEKYCLGNLENRVGILAAKLDCLFPKNTQQDGIKEIYFQLEKQTSSLQKLATDFAEQVGKKFDTSLQENLAPTLIKLGQATEKLVMTTQNTNENAIRTLFDNVHNLFSNAADEEINGLKNSLKEITNKNDEMFSRFADSIKTVEELMENQRNIISQTNLSAGNVEKTNSRVENLSSELNDIISKLGNFSRTQQDSNEDSRALLRDIKENIGYQNEASLMISNILKENLSTVQVQKNMYADLKETVTSLNKFNEHFSPVIENMSQNITNFHKSSELINNKFLTTFNELDRYYNTINNSIGTTFSTFDKSMNQFKNEIMEDLTNINSKYNDIATRLDKFSENSMEFTEKFKEFSEAQQVSQEIWKSYKDSFDNLNEEITEGVKDYTVAVRGGLNDIFKQYDDSITNAFEKIRNLTETLNDSVEQLTEFYENKVDKGA